MPVHRDPVEFPLSTGSTMRRTFDAGRFRLSDLEHLIQDARAEGYGDDAIVGIARRWGGGWRLDVTVNGTLKEKPRD